jgi:hypothetical protein
MDNTGKVSIHKYQLIQFEEGKLFGWSRNS